MEKNTGQMITQRIIAPDKIVEGKLDKYYEAVCLLNQPAIREPDTKVSDLLSELITKLGENIVISRFSRFELGVSDG